MEPNETTPEAAAALSPAGSYRGPTVGLLLLALLILFGLYLAGVRLVGSVGGSLSVAS